MLKLPVNDILPWRKHGFIGHHEFLTGDQVKSIDKLVGTENSQIVDEFEKGYASIVGNGWCVAYASARMGFYDLLRLLGIGSGDEVVIPSFTCAVMVNAILRTAATPVFVDLDCKNFGLSMADLKLKTTPNTKMIVAQHSFGIPCNIEAVKAFTVARGIFLLEDCALSLGSFYKSKAVGTFGNAALFSTDHTKPINTMVGGLIYTEDMELARRLKRVGELHPNLNLEKQIAIWEQIKLERFTQKPACFRFHNSISRAKRIIDKCRFAPTPFLDADNDCRKHNQYPYPAKLPAFLAALGVLQIRRWATVREIRVEALKKFLAIFKNSEFDGVLPVAYFDKKRDIVPFRLVWFSAERNKIIEKLREKFDVNSIWFYNEISGASQTTRDRLINSTGSSTTRIICDSIVNIPTPDCLRGSEQVLKDFSLLLRSKD